MVAAERGHDGDRERPVRHEHDAGIAAHAVEPAGLVRDAEAEQAFRRAHELNPEDDAAHLALKQLERADPVTRAARSLWGRVRSVLSGGRR